MNIEDVSALITPIALLLICLTLVIKLRRDVNPIVLGMVRGLSIQAQSNAMYFAMLTLVTATAGFGVMTDEARLLGFVKIAAGAKIISLSCSAALAFMIKSPASSFSSPETPKVVQVVEKTLT